MLHGRAIPHAEAAAAAAAAALMENPYIIHYIQWAGNVSLSRLLPARDKTVWWFSTICEFLSSLWSTPICRFSRQFCGQGQKGICDQVCVSLMLQLTVARQIDNRWKTGRCYYMTLSSSEAHTRTTNSTKSLALLFCTKVYKGKNGILWFFSKNNQHSPGRNVIRIVLYVKTKINTNLSYRIKSR